MPEKNWKSYMFAQNLAKKVKIKKNYSRKVFSALALSSSRGKMDNGDNGLQAHSHHDKFPPWWVFVRDDYGGNLSVTKSHH